MDARARCYRFGPFSLDPSRRQLEKAGQSVALSARGFDILLTLIEGRDRVLSRSEIIAAVWPGIAVEEHNLSVQMSNLRRSIGDTNDDARLIATIPGRGYRFVAGIEEPQAAAPAAAAADEARDIGVVSIQAPPRRITRAGWIIVAGVVVLIAASARLLLLPAARPDAGPPRLSIVVLPFQSLDEDAGNTDLADSMTDDLTTELSHIPGSLVIARTSAQAIRARQVSADQVGRILHVQYVLEGSVRRMQGKLRVNAQLIEAARDDHVWAEHYDGDTARLWDTQTDIVRRVADAVDHVLLHREVGRIMRERPGNQDALDWFYRARSIIDRGDSLDQVTQAQGLLERAVAAEPDFIDALTALGWLLARKMQTYDYPTYMRDSVEAEAVTAHALALAPDTPAVLAARGRVLAYLGKCDRAGALFGAALATEPGNLMALNGMANCAWLTGQPDKVTALLPAILRIDPQGPATIRHNQLLGLAALFSGHPKSAIAALLDADDGANGLPDQVTPIETTRLFLIAAYMLAGEPDEARRRYAAYQASFPHRTVWRQMTSFTSAQEHMPEFAAIAAALHDAGMPKFADEYQDDHVAPQSVPLSGSELTPTPLAIPGGSVIDTAGLARWRDAPPLIIDVGRGRTVIAGSLLLSDADAALNRPALMASSYAGQLGRAAAGIVVMGTSSFGTNSYNTALHFIAMGFKPVYWYRGGEEAWAKAGLHAEDRRSE